MSGKHLLSAQPGQLHGAIKTYDVTVSGSFPTSIPLVKLAGRKDLIIQNGSTMAIWVGGGDVTRHNGIEVTASGGVYGAQIGRADLYAITSPSTTISGIRVMEIA